MNACSVDPIKSLKTSYHLQYVLFVCLLQMNQVFFNIFLPKNTRSRKTYEYKFFRKQARSRKLYALLDRNLSKVKQFIKNHIQVEETNLLHHRLPCFYKNNQCKWFFKWSNQGIRSNLNVTSKTCFLLRTSLIPITQITSGCIILDKNTSFLNMNDLFKMTIYSFQLMAEDLLKHLLGKG